MLKIGSPGIISLVFLLTFFIPAGQLSAQQVNVSATLSETNIFAGERVMLNLKISGPNLSSARQPELPPINGVQWLRNFTSTSRSYSSSEGISLTYGYTLVARDIGTFTIPALSFQVDGRTYTTKPISFNILDPKTIDQGNAERAPDLYVRLEPSTSTPVIGQQMVADIVLYFKSGIEVSSFQATPGWKAEGFWKEELENGQRATTTSTIINGVRYQRARLLQYALFPTKAGELELSPFTISVAVRKQGRSPFGFGFGLNSERTELSTLPVTISVKELPGLTNAEFIGAVGQFQITRSMEPVTAFVGESVEIKTQISGTGNVPLINKPEYEFPEALERYNPQENSNILRANRVISGSKTFTDIVIARAEGTFVVPEKRLAFYDPRRKRYDTVVLPALTLSAKYDPTSTGVKETEQRLSVTPYLGLATWSSTRYRSLTSRVGVWVMFFIPFIFIGIGYFVRRYRDRLETDVAFSRSRKASSVAEQWLEEAEQSDDVRSGYHVLERAVIQFVSDKLNLPEAGLSPQAIYDALSAKDQALANEAKRLLDKCASLAYAPNISQQDLSSDLEKAKTLIKSLKKAL
ncbi:MAG: BatD family protein [Bacteroidota bacterium]